MLCKIVTALLLLQSTICTAQVSHDEKELLELTAEARRNHSRLAVVSAINNNASAPQYVVVGYEEAKRRDPSTPKFRPDPMPKVPHYPQLVIKNSSQLNLPKGDLPQIPNRPIIEKNRPLIFEKSKFEIINEYLEERISNLTVKIHNSNYDCGNNGGGGGGGNLNSELVRLRKKNEELSYRNKVLEAENILLTKMVNNNGSYVKIVSNQPLKPVHCFEIENKYRMCEANKHTLQSSISNLLNMNKNFPTTLDNNKNCSDHTEELKKCLISVEQCFEEAESTVTLLQECETISNKNLDQLEEVEKDVLRLNLDNKFVTQQIIDVNNGYSELKNVTLEFYNKIFDYAINIQEEGKFNESLTILYLILEARSIISGQDDPETITTEHEIAFLLNNYKIAKYDEAHRLFTQVLEKRRRIYGDEHPDTLLTLYNVADVMRNLRRNSMYYQEYLDMVEPSHSYRDNSES